MLKTKLYYTSLVLHFATVLHYTAIMKNTTKNKSKIASNSGALIVPVMVDLVAERTSQGQNLFNVFKDLNINPIDFLKYITDNPAQAEKIDASLRLYIERILFSSFNEIDLASDKLELEKINLKLRSAQWLAERRVSKVYAAKQEINVNQTIDIRQALQLADKRVSTVIDCTPNKRKELISLNDELASAPIDKTDKVDSDILG